MPDDCAMESITTKQVRLVLDGDRLLIAPASRPNDYRELAVAQIDRWATRKWGEMALQPPVEPPKEEA